MDIEAYFVQQFCEMTEATPEQARAHLESCEWKFETAISSFSAVEVVPPPPSPQDDDEQQQDDDKEVLAAAAILVSIKTATLVSTSGTECLKELETAIQNTSVVPVNVVKQEPEYVTFQGIGRTVGRSNQPLHTSSAFSATTPICRAASNQPSQGLVVDNTKPVTSIRLRLRDGTHLVARFNPTHTVANIRGVINAARPGYSGPYNLQSIQQLSDPSQTIEQAGLINAVVIESDEVIASVEA